MRLASLSVHAATRVSLAVLIAGLAGCAPKDPFMAWQEGVTRYVDGRGHGSISALRATSDLRSPRSHRPAQLTIGELNVPVAGSGLFSETRDVRGVLLGIRRVDQRDWCFFLVGVISRQSEHPRIEEIRLVGLIAESRGLRWSMTEADRAVLDRYLSSQTGNQTPHPAQHHLLFPGLEDVFRLEVSGSVVTATETRSGACWKLVIPQGPE
jgi:hypothetical protein